MSPILSNYQFIEPVGREGADVFAIILNAPAEMLIGARKLVRDWL